MERFGYPIVREQLLNRRRKLESALATAAASRVQPARELAATLVADLSAFAAGAPRQDDVTVLVLRRGREGVAA